MGFKENNSKKQTEIPDSTAVRVALWRALHVQVDEPPHVLEGEIGLKLASPPEGWRQRPDMNPQWTSPFRASIVLRARFVDGFDSKIPRGKIRWPETFQR